MHVKATCVTRSNVLNSGLATSEVCTGHGDVAVGELDHVHLADAGHHCVVLGVGERCGCVDRHRDRGKRSVVSCVEVACTVAEESAIVAGKVNTTGCDFGFAIGKETVGDGKAHVA